MRLFNSTSRLIANHYLTLPEVGILSAYQGATTQTAIFFLTAAVQVFFPIASRTPDKQLLFAKLAKAMGWVSLPGFIGFCGIVWFYFRILGHNYPMRLDNVLLFSAAGLLTLFSGVFIWYLSSTGLKGMIGGSVAGLAGGVVHFLLGLWWIPQYRLPGAAIAYILATLVTIGGCFFVQFKNKLIAA